MNRRKSDIMLELENQTMTAEYKQSDIEGMTKRLDEYKQIIEAAKGDKDGDGNQI